MLHEQPIKSISLKPPEVVLSLKVRRRVHELDFVKRDFMMKKTEMSKRELAVYKFYEVTYKVSRYENQKTKFSVVFGFRKHKLLE